MMTMTEYMNTGTAENVTILCERPISQNPLQCSLCDRVHIRCTKFDKKSSTTIILTYKMELVSGALKNWFKSYLSQRSHFVSI